MPKVIPSSRRTRALHQSQPSSTDQHSYGSQTTAMNVLWTSSPRKVSFEDGHQSSSSFGGSAATSATALSSANTSSNSIASSTSMTPSCKSSLRRKAPSVCLVGLAQQPQPDCSQRNCQSPTADMQDSHSNSYNDLCHNSPQQQHGQNTAPSSPWGHFVDILVPLDEDDNSQKRSPEAGFFGFLQVPDVEEDEDVNDYNAPPYYGSANSHRSLSSSLGNKRHKHRRCSPSPHPYALLPRHHQRNKGLRRTITPKKSFLPGFLVEPTADTTTEAVGLDVMEDEPRTTESSDAPTHEEVARALQRLQV